MRIALAFLLSAPLLAQSLAPADFYEKKIRPIFAAKCYACHSGGTPMAGLNFSSPTGFDNVIVKGDAAQSRLYQAVSHTSKIKMPPAGKLADAEITDIKAWIEMGAPQPLAVSGNRAERSASHWAFQPIRDYKPPTVKNKEWARSPIDRFILAKLEEKSMQRAPPASKLRLLRRVTYDLIGLPPTPREIEAFLADRTNGAYAKVVDRLLASPQYGEQWGRHWLDVARYADSTGMDEDVFYPNAWRYRDYVVSAFNEDLPYDRFITEQIAGDLLPAATPGGVNQRGIIATGLLALGPKPLVQQDRIRMIYDVVDEQIDTVSKAFLGLTIACARCHDHKFDPILTKDYYSLASIFASTAAFRNLGKPGGVSYIYYAPLDRAAYERYQAHRWSVYAKQLEMEEVLAQDWARQQGLLQPKIADFLAAAWKEDRKGISIEAAAAAQGVDARQVENWSRWLRSADEKARQGYLKNLMGATEETLPQITRQYREEYAKAATGFDNRMETWRRKYAMDAAQDRELLERPKPAEDTFFAAVTFNGGPMELPDSPRVARLRSEWKQLEERVPPEPPMASGVCDGPIVHQRVFLHGDNNSPGEPVAKQFPIVLAGNTQAPITKGSGRLELARWLAAPDHPLTARVMVNRIWQWHFGEALVRTPNNWGKMGETPTHPELLDFLAKRFIESGWSIKAMHRMILLSSVYQMDSQTTKETREADPENRFYARFNRVRMSVEQIRDSFLALSGKLDLTVGGTVAGKVAPGKAPGVDPDELSRRTLYIPVQRGNIPVVLQAFDYGDATTSSEGRPRTNVAPQALFMLNSRFVLEQASGFARRLLGDAALSEEQRVERAYLMALGRQPEGVETESALSYISGLEKKLDPQEAHLMAWRSYCHLLMSRNEFLYLN